MDPWPIASAEPNEDQTTHHDLEEFPNPDPIVGLAPLMAFNSHPDPSLRKAIQKKISPWRRSIEEPPFTEEQLVVMALAHEGRLMTGKAIFCWITAKLPYYLKLSCEFLWEHGALCGDPLGYGPRNYSGGGLAGKAHDFRMRFCEAFERFEVPITKITLVDDVSTPWSNSGPSEQTQWSISASAARIYLESLLETVSRKDDSNFPFLRLPYELRLRIYEMVFAFPCAGIRLYRRKKDLYDSPNQTGGMYMESITRSLRDLESRETWFVRRNSNYDTNEISGFVKCQRPSQLLSLFLVCRKLYEEAMPVFFDINTFVFRSMDEMFDFLKPLRADRRKHVRSVLLGVFLDIFDGLKGFGYMQEELKAQQLKDRAEILKTCTGLADLEIVLRDHEGRGSFGSEPTSCDHEVHQALSVFARLECCHVHFGGDRPTKWETRFARYKEPMRIGRAMICS